MMHQQLLDVADNLERAIASAKEAGEGGGDSSHDVLLQGVEMTAEEVLVQQWWLRVERGVVFASDFDSLLCWYCSYPSLDPEWVAYWLHSYTYIWFNIGEKRLWLS